MAAFPPFILKRLYVGGSLQATTDGFEFALRNNLASGTVVEIRGLEVDGKPRPPAEISLRMPDGTRRTAADVSRQQPLALSVGVTVWFGAPDRLSPGRHSLKLGLVTREMGDLGIPVTDTVKEAAPVGAERPAAETGPASSHRPGPSPDPVRTSRPLRIAIIGAGSTVFARQLMTDILCTPGLEEGTFTLVDIDARRLELAHHIGEKLVQASGRRWRVEATADRRRALPGCHYVINSIEVAGLRNVRHDYDIPLKYGIDQCIGDTSGPGGVFKMLRTGPAWLEILRDVEKLCPSAVVMNYTNPMSALTLLALRATRLQVVGLCHSVPNTAEQLAGYLDVPVEALRYRCAGINHLAWYTELRVDGVDQYPKLAERARDPEIWESDPVRFEVMKHFGAFITESSGHLSEYLPYFRKRPELVRRYTRDGYRGESGFYANNWPTWRSSGDESIRDVLEGRSALQLHRSSEYASLILESMECDRPQTFHGNVLNRGLIENLPEDGCVEVAVLADSTGLHPVKFGALPPQMAALDRAHAAPHELMAAAVLDRDREAARHALMLDPLTAAVCSLEEIGSLFDEMWQAEREDLEYYRR